MTAGSKLREPLHLRHMKQWGELVRQIKWAELVFGPSLKKRWAVLVSGPNSPDTFVTVNRSYYAPTTHFIYCKTPT